MFVSRIKGGHASLVSGLPDPRDHEDWTEWRTDPIVRDDRPDGHLHARVTPFATPFCVRPDDVCVQVPCMSRACV